MRGLAGIQPELLEGTVQGNRETEAPRNGREEQGMDERDKRERLNKGGKR
jgi:hypothetical protein